MEQQLQQLGVQLAFVAKNNAGRLCSRLCRDSELKNIMLDQLASHYTKLGNDYVSHLGESHKCIGCFLTHSAPHWTSRRRKVHMSRMLPRMLPRTECIYQTQRRPSPNDASTK